MQEKKHFYAMLDLSVVASLGSFQDLLIFRVSRNLPGAHHFPLDLQSISVQKPVFSQLGLSVQLKNGFSF